MTTDAELTHPPTHDSRQTDPPNLQFVLISEEVERRPTGNERYEQGHGGEPGREF
jgi:hypothetical protein